MTAADSSTPKLTPRTDIDTSASNPHRFVATDMDERGEYTPVWFTEVEGKANVVQMNLTRTLSAEDVHIPAILRSARAAINHATNVLGCSVIAHPVSTAEVAVCARLDMVRLGETSWILPYVAPISKEALEAAIKTISELSTVSLDDKRGTIISQDLTPYELAMAVLSAASDADAKTNFEAAE